VGTSMGAIIGGLYSIGYSAGEIDSLISSQDWSVIMSDQIPRKEITYEERYYRSRYPIRVPFSLGERALPKDISAASNEMSNSSELSSDTLTRGGISILDNLPMALVNGQNIYNLFTSLSAGYQDSLDFNRMPIPFACVAADVISKKEVVFRSGHFVDAIRSSMAIPGYFAPVRIGDMVLVDGGALNNYPVDVARQMGADIIIGVKLGKVDEVEQPCVNNIGDLVSEIIDMYTDSKLQHNIDSTDILIRPSTKGFGTLSFDAGSIRSLIANGEEAARQLEPQLKELHSLLEAQKLSEDSVLVGPRPMDTRMRYNKAIRLDRDSVTLGYVSYSGLTPYQHQLLFRHSSLVPGAKLAGGEIDREITRFYNTSAFESVTYTLKGKESPYGMHIKFVPGYNSEIGLGFRMDTEEIAVVSFETGINRYALYGSSFDLVAKLSYNPVLKMRYSYSFPSAFKFNAEYLLRSSLVLVDDYFKFVDNTFRLNVSSRRFIDMYTELGLEYKNFHNKSSQYLIYDSALPYDVDHSRRNFVSCRFEANLNTMDDDNIPAKGGDFSLEAFYCFPKLSSGDGNSPFSGLSAHFRYALSTRNGRFALIPEIYHRTVIGNNIPSSFMNLMGGYVAGRYMDQQIPFVGFIGTSAFGKSLTSAQLDCRIGIAGNHYLNATASYAFDGNTLGEVFNLNGIWGARAGYLYNSKLGPLSLNLFWSDFTSRFGFYASFGYSF